jgi:hypothetical protein
MNASLPPALPTDSPLPPASPTLKTRSTAITAAIACMILTVVSCFVPVVGYFFAGTFGAIALIMIIVAMAQGDQRGLPLLITHIVGTPLACLFASIVSCVAMVGMMGTGGGAVAAITKPTPLPGSSVNRYQTLPINISSPGHDLKTVVAPTGALKPTVTAVNTPEPTIAAASTPERTVTAASIPEPTVVAANTPERTVTAASIPAFEMIRPASMVSAITSNRWSGDALIVSGTLKNTNAVPVRIESLSATGFDKNQKRVIEGSDYTILHNDLASGETVNFKVAMKDGTKQIKFVKVTPEVAKQ